MRYYINSRKLCYTESDAWLIESSIARVSDKILLICAERIKEPAAYLKQGVNFQAL